MEEGAEEGGREGRNDDYSIQTASIAPNKLRPRRGDGEGGRGGVEGEEEVD